jgi:hypothetical protein
LIAGDESIDSSDDDNDGDESIDGSDDDDRVRVRRVMLMMMR